MLGLLDLERIRRFGSRRFLLLLVLCQSALFFGVFVAIGVVIDGQYIARRELLAISLGVGVILSAVFGRHLGRPAE